MNDSILTSVKKEVGITEEYANFDQDIIDAINTVFADLYQLGVGPSEPFSIQNDKAKWKDFFGDRKDLNSVRSYMYLRVRLIFNPPQQAFVLASMERQIEKFEFRLNLQAETEG